MIERWCPRCDWLGPADHRHLCSALVVHDLPSVTVGDVALPIQPVTIKAGDVLVVRSELPLLPQARAEIIRQVGRCFRGHEVLVLDSLTLDVMRPEDAVPDAVVGDGMAKNGP